ncbi:MULTISPECIES: hypothetical protein [unclassified Acinetobacter]|uniref:Chromosome partition protein Smc n=5 Tax=root TaxID=1 RepID=A0A644XLM0_9ZZZZ|nr:MULTISPECIES: hypothetical protein [unclassified Acinetobacter]
MNNKISSAVTKQDVYDAIEQLLKENGRYTNQLIMDLIGGSSVTIQKYRKEYEREHREDAEKKAVALKDSEQKKLSEVVADIVAGRITEIGDSYASEITRLSEELEIALADKESLSEENSSQLTEIEQLTSENQDLKAKLKFLEEEHARSKAEIIEQYEQHKKVISEQYAEAKQQYSEGLAEFKQSNTALKAERDQLQLKVAEAQSNERVASVRLEEAQKNISRFQTEISELKSEIRDLRAPHQPQQLKKKGKVEEQPIDDKTGDLLAEAEKP